MLVLKKSNKQKYLFFEKFVFSQISKIRFELAKNLLLKMKGLESQRLNLTPQEI